MSGINPLKGRTIILQDCRFDYTDRQIKKFIRLWEQGHDLTYIASKFYTSTLDMALLTMHCDLEGLIQPRPGGAYGSVKRNREVGRRRKEVIEIEA